MHFYNKWKVEKLEYLADIKTKYNMPDVLYTYTTCCLVTYYRELVQKENSV